MNRRSFIQQSSIAALAGFALHCAGETTPQAAETMPVGKQRPHLTTVGLQLYTLRSIMGEDFVGPIRQAAQIGYKEFEFAGYGDLSAEQIRALLDELGVRSPSTHVSAQLIREDLAGLISRSKVIGHEYLICPHPGELPFKTMDDFKAMAAKFNEWGKVCKDAGLQFGYHNHSFEFEAIDGATTLPMDVLLENTDPDLVAIELDLCWAINAGADPIAYFEKYPGRFHLCHVKDLDAAGELADVGQGRIDFAPIFAKAQTAGLKHYVVEHDRPSDPIASIRNSYNYLTGA
ncbi:MAG: sugar phosphate isomerase/epimerase [Rhodothermales bacterium]